MASKNAKVPQARPLTGAAKVAKAKARKASWVRRGELALMMLVGSMAIFIIAVAGYISYLHIYDVAVYARQSLHIAAAMPITADGMILIASYRLRKANLPLTGRIISLIMMAIGLIASAGGNALYAVIQLPQGVHTLQDWLTVIFSVWPVIPLFGALEMLVHTHKAPGVLGAMVKRAKASAPKSQVSKAPRARKAAPVSLDAEYEALLSR